MFINFILLYISAVIMILGALTIFILNRKCQLSVRKSTYLKCKEREKLKNNIEMLSFLIIIFTLFILGLSGFWFDLAKQTTSRDIASAENYAYLGVLLIFTLALNFYSLCLSVNKLKKEIKELKKNKISSKNAL